MHSAFLWNRVGALTSAPTDALASASTLFHKVDVLVSALTDVLASMPTL